MDKLKLGKLHRHISFERASLDEDNRKLSFSFSSEEPVERWFGEEILDHSKGAIRLKRLKSGGPLLLDHDSRKQIGVVEKVSIGEDRKGRVDVRFGKGELSEEIYQDVLDGIRTNVSVGYQIHRMLLEEESGENKIYRATDWEPYEVSLVSIPADISVGVGRGEDDSHETEIERTNNKFKENRTMNKCQFCGAELNDGVLCTCQASVSARSKPPVVDTAKIEQETRSAELKRVREIHAIGEKHKVDTKAAIDAGDSVDSFRTFVLDEVEKRDVQVTPDPPKKEPKIDANYRYDKRALAPWEGHKDAERQAFAAGKWVQGVLLGDEKAKRWVKENMGERVMTEGVGTGGGFAVPDELENGIINLRDAYGAARRLATVYPMGSATLDLPKRASGNTAYFKGEETAATASDLGLGQVQLAVKDLYALTLISKSLAEDAVFSIAALVADEHGQAFAEKEDACFILGDGTSTYGGMVGLKTLTEATAYAGRVTSTSGDDTFQEITSGDLSRMMASIRSYAKTGAVWLASPTADDLVFGRLAAAAGGNTIQTLNGGTGMSYLGYRRETAEDCPSGAATDYTSLTMLYFGNFKKGVALGDRRGISMQVLNERYAEYGQIGVISSERFDLNIHDLGTTAVTGSISYLYGNS